MRRVSQHYDAEVAKAGLKTTQYSLLSHVLQARADPPRRPGGAMTIDASTLTRNLKPLVGAGWLELSAGDRRAQPPGAASPPPAATSAPRRSATGRRRRSSSTSCWASSSVVALHALIDESLERLSPLPSGG